MSQNHEWIRYTQQLVDVIVAPDGQPFSVERPGEPIGEAVGCNLCGVPLSADYMNLPCEPIDTPLPLA